MSIVQTETTDNWPLTTLPGLYVHVPFCLRKCAYCDFYSINDQSLILAWLTALEKESGLYKDRFGVFDTLYLGGGTPSLLNTRQFASLLHILRRPFSFAPDTEVSLEANPDDLTPEKLRVYKDLGVNRLSVGGQSFNDRELAFLGRRHNVRQTVAALEAARAAGFGNLSLDLIFGLPGQSLENWRHTLEQALVFDPEHLSCYQLTYEPETPLGRRKARGEVIPATEEEEREFFLFTSRFLEERGYRHYEISNFARQEPGAEPCYSRHNRKYWNHTPYLGLGPGAHSFQEGVRWWNAPSVEQYCQELAQGRKPVAGRETLAAAQLQMEALYLGLRTREGVSLDLLRQVPGWEKTLHNFKKAGLLEVHQDRVAPTLQGFLLADSLPLRFLDEGLEEKDMGYQGENTLASAPWPLAPDPWFPAPEP
ncbi:MAG: radical SAM family heme chaperone HemW [Thermodesulfobacteriota bacterium]